MLHRLRSVDEWMLLEKKQNKAGIWCFRYKKRRFRKIAG